MLTLPSQRSFDIIDAVMRLNLFRGWPGSGKSSAAQRMFPGVLLCENDMFHMHNGQYDWKAESMPKAISWCMDMVRTALENGLDVCVANTFTKRKFVDAYKKIAEELGAEFYVYRCTDHFQNQHGLSDSMVRSFEKAMEDWPGEKRIGTGEDLKRRLAVEW